MQKVAGHMLKVEDLEGLRLADARVYAPDGRSVSLGGIGAGGPPAAGGSLAAGGSFDGGGANADGGAAGGWYCSCSGRGAAATRPQYEPGGADAEPTPIVDRAARSVGSDAGSSLCCNAESPCMPPIVADPSCAVPAGPAVRQLVVRAAGRRA